ncbi:MAG TPA: geranylgeranyl reductase family protein [Gaiellaceae bacterium]|jgi:geranylgeranyl reductase family protein
MRRYDAIVVGAGPAGSMTAYHLAEAGADVVLLDRARFPRDKPCGGGVTGRAARALPFTIEPVVEHVVTLAELGLGYGRRVERGSGEPLVYMTQRKRLDAYLVEKAVEAGAELRDGVRVTEVESNGAGPRVVAGGERLEAETLVGADGANGITAKALGLGGNREIGVALEGNAPYDRIDATRYRGRLIIEFDTVPGGYAWVFPKGDHANFGVGGWGSEGPNLRAHLARLCEEHGIQADDLTELRGFRLPLRSPGSTLARGRTLVVGDAGGLIDPVSGDGMFEGFHSGRRASEAIVELLAGRRETLDAYSPDLNRELATHYYASWSVKAALDRFPRAAFAIAQTGLVWNVVEGIVRGQIRDVHGARSLAKPGLKALAILARWSGDPGRAYRVPA